MKPGNSARSICRVLALAGLVAGLPFPNATAQGFPDKPMRLIVPVTPGGAADVLARFLASDVQANTKQPVVVENRPGAGGYIGMGACAKSPPDGYTMCLTTPDVLTYGPWLYSNPPLDAANDFSGVSQLVIIHGLFYTGAGSPLNSFKDLLAQVKAKPDSVNFGTWGPGSIPDLFVRYINREMGIGVTVVPYKGAADVLREVLGGQIQAGYFAVGAVLPQIRAGKLRPLVVTSARRSPYLPEVPALGEFGVNPGFVSYFGLYAPANVPGPVLQRLYEEFTRPLKTAQGTKFIESQTMELVASPPAEFQKFMRADRENAGQRFRDLGVKASPAPN
jgi:tripartite-type tricarboxylate transporter receptor subunit TctC